MVMNHEPKLFKTGISAMDEQHSTLLALTDKLLKSLNSDTTKETLLLQCSALVSATRLHFDDEERLMLKHFYPDTEAHIGLHMNHKNILASLISHIRGDQLTMARDTLVYLSRWHLDHINDADHKYADYIQSQSA